LNAQHKIMKIKLIGKIFPPQTELRAGGRGLPVVLEGEIIVTLTPRMLQDIILSGGITLPGSCHLLLQRDGDGYFQNVHVNKQNTLVTINGMHGYLQDGSTRIVSRRIRQLIRKGLKLKLTKEENRRFGYLIDDYLK
jgi:hypothetical protein